jgi:phosphate-selective porin OprO/OprP
MSSIRPRSLPLLAAVWAALALSALPLLAQQGEDLANPAHFLQEPPAGEMIDREVVRAIVREELRAETAPPPASAAAHPETEWIEVGKDRTLIGRWDNGFVGETADKSFRIHLGGRLEFDNSWFAQDDNILIGPSPDTEMRDGTLMRRARFRTDGRLWEFIDFACEVNFANIQDVSNVDNALVQVGSVGLTDFYVTFREFPWLGNVRVGHVQAPISLERYSSSNAWYYMERSSMFDAFYNPNDYQNGIVAFDSYFDDRVTLAGSAAWIGKADVQSFAFGAHDGKYGVGARATALPMYEDEGRTLLHVGAGYFHQALVDDRFSIASRPLLRAGAGSTQTPNLIFTGTFFTPNGVDLFNVEAAFVRGPFSLSSEYAVTHVSDVFEQSAPTFAGPRGDVTYHAAYVEGGLFVTPGDQRRYDKKTGTWARTNPVENAYLVRDAGLCGRGAAQLVARYTYLDLVSGTPVLTPTTGGARAGRQHDVTLGVNWYLNSQMWIMVNYVATHIDSVVPGADGDLHGIGCRLHLDF